MFKQILVEKDISDLPYTKQLLSSFSNIEINYIDSYQQYFGQIKKNYLRKRDDLNLFLAQKKGKLVKLAPEAYGTIGEEHYYYVHAYNCIYECNYCYLQGYFDSPDIVLFVNHEEIINEMNHVFQARPDHTKGLWFHAGEFSDTLALSHLTKELKLYHSFFKKNPLAKWELRTKSVNIKEILKLEPLPNMITSFSLSPSRISKENDLKTPGSVARIKAAKKLQETGHLIALHLDPIILTNQLEEEYTELLDLISKYLNLEAIQYLSIGVVRFSSEVYHQVQKNYEETEYLHRDFIQAEDGKIKYPLPLRNWILSKVKQICLKSGFQESKIYECMEDNF